MSADHHKNSTNGDADLANSSNNEDEENNNRNARRTQQDLQSRSFWKAGDFDVGSTTATLEQGQLVHARVHPKFLHSNATSHKWAFGAIAELLDNAVDEISKGGTFVKLDKISNAKDHTPALLFQDNGGGMDPGSLRQCMSLGYSNKKGDTIGQYGNGFKTSTMRLGADVIVFTCTTHGSRATQSIGLLSYTFLRTTGQEDVIVPMIDFEFFGDRREPILYSSLEEWSSNLRIILEWSPFALEEELMLQFEDIGPHGTKIMIYNLWLNDDGLLELDFNCDEEDMRLRDEANREKSLKKFDKLIESHISYHIRFSLRAYLSILYLNRFDNFEIILRGKPVQQHNIVNDLKYTEVVMYRPKLGTTSKEVLVKTEIGFVKEAPLLQVSGFNVYHKNRLIRPFWKVNSNHNSMGNGVVGVLEANFIEPAHDKQDFERSALFFKLETKLKQMSSDFWKKQCHLLGIGTKSLSIIRPDSQKESPNPVDAVEANFQTNFGTDQAVIGLSANMQRGVFFSNPVIGLAANPHSLSNVQAGNPREGSRHQDSSKYASVDHSSFKSLDQICEENIQLFMRCEEHRQKETDLKQMIEELERELMETKRKCSQLSSHLETQKKKKTTEITHPTEKA